VNTLAIGTPAFIDFKVVTHALTLTLTLTLTLILSLSIRFYRAMHFSAKRGIAIACRLSVCPSVCLSVTLVNCDHIG